ncbi:amidase [Bacillus sp. FJAT-50079]|nr:amidase [Bacillus sp. FJAT-50079]
MDATELAGKIRNEEISSVEATSAFISHLQHINPTINALVEDRFTAALKEAEAADLQMKVGNAKGKLFGVPISVKESFDVSNMKTTSGLRHRNNMVMSEDATIVQKLKEEGAIILGKTNTPTLCFCQESDNKLYGRTNNPWDVRKTAGGSSGGEAALIAVGGAAAGVGSDIGGSIRFPSHFNGVIGFKSGYGQVDVKGSFPKVEHPLQDQMLGIGPIVKSVRDARLIYGIIAKEKKERTHSEPITIEFLSDIGFPLANHTSDLLEQIKERLPFQSVENIPPYFKESALLWQEIMSIDGGASMVAAASSERKMNPVKEYLKEKLSHRSEYHDYLTWALIGTRLFKPNHIRIKEIEATIGKGSKTVHHYLENKVLIMPVYHETALNHGQLYRELFSIKKTFLKYMPFVAYPNVWGLPSLTIPIGKDEKGLPIGIQLISCNGNEELIFNIGEIVEEHFRGYIRCNLHDEMIS